MLPASWICAQQVDGRHTLFGAGAVAAGIYADGEDGDWDNDVVNFAGLDLSGANLRGMRFALLDLSGANLSNADLTGASLRDTNLQNAKLLSANLTDARLETVDLLHADLSGATLANTSFSETQCPDGVQSDANDSCAGHL